VGLASRSDALRWRQADIAAGVTLGEQLSDGSMPIVHPDTPAIEVANLMIAEDIGRVCVVAPADGRLIGIIARRNLLQARASKVREERPAG
jgi:CBS domain-containing protein